MQLEWSQLQHSSRSTTSAVVHRPTQPAHFWPDEPFVLAGRDALRLGTWLGLTKHGRFSLLTNYREVSNGDTAATKVTLGLCRGYALQSCSTPCCMLQPRTDAGKQSLLAQAVGSAIPQGCIRKPNSSPPALQLYTWCPNMRAFADCLGSFRNTCVTTDRILQ
jgi:hypothetical protein